MHGSRIKVGCSLRSRFRVLLYARQGIGKVHQSIILALPHTKSAKRRAGINVKVGPNFSKRVLVAKPVSKIAVKATRRLM
jgi:hypothetical protein